MTIDNRRRIQCFQIRFKAMLWVDKIVRPNAKKKGFNIYPPEKGIGKYMSRTLSHLGINPFFSLMVGGFKVGENLLRGKIDDKLVQIL